MTIEEMIYMQCRLYSRMDKEADMKVAFSNFLRQAHSIDFFRRDIQNQYVLNPAITNGVVQVDLITQLSLLRRVWAVNIYTNYSQVGVVVYPAGLILTEKPYTAANPGELVDYYNFPVRFTYSITGTTLQIRDVDTRATCVELQSFGYPTYAQDLINGEWETDSWIMREFPLLLEAYCKVWICSYVTDQKLQNEAAVNFVQRRQEFIAAYAQEIVRWQ